MGSDLDLLVDMDADRSLLDLSGFVLELQDLLDVAVDVVTDGNHLDPRFRAAITGDCITL